MNEFQPTLFDVQPLVTPQYEEGMTQRQRWWEFHCRNPHVYNSLRSLALGLKSQGFKKCGIALLWEQLRWQSYIKTHGEGEYKLSNSYRAYYSRFLMAREPELREFFRVRPQPTEEQV
jgi:hypothetical protein